MSKFVIIPLTIFMFLSFTACEQDTRTKLVGEWVMIMDGGKEPHEDVRHIFDEDGKVEVKTDGELINEGTWTLEEDMLQIITLSGNELEYKVASIEKGEMYLVANPGTEEESVIVYMWFE